MKIYIFSDTASVNKAIQKNVHTILDIISQETDVSDLVVAVYFTKRIAWTGGVAVVRQWQTPHKFINRRGRWNITMQYPVPQDLPEKFKLIRLLVPADFKIYPKTETDIYHWQHTFATWQDHLAHLFAHELHHFRRYHLGLHPREGEHSANKWALQTATQYEFKIHSEKLKTPKKKTRKKSITFNMVLNPMDFGYARMNRVSMAQLTLSLSPRAKKKYIQEKLAHFEQLRQLKCGDNVTITFDPSQRYTDQQAFVVRIMKRNSVRLVIRTHDGKEWRWPLSWLST